MMYHILILSVCQSVCHPSSLCWNSKRFVVATCYADRHVSLPAALRAAQAASI